MSETNIKGHIKNLRHHKKILFLDLLTVNSIILTKILTKNEIFMNLLSRLSLGSWLNIITEKEGNKENFLIIKIKEIRYNHSNLDPYSSHDWNSLTNKKNRWLLFRNQEYRKIMILREKIENSVKCFLRQRGHLEIKTPILTAPSEEGARNYLVISRNRGKFYSLAQSPQIYKQFLTYGGLNYFQIAPVFRDEDGRLDRMNGEFYQIDVERITDNLKELKNLAIDLIKEILIEYDISFVYQGEIDYHTSLKMFNTDKPVDIFKEVFKFKGNSETILNLIIVDKFPMFEKNKLGKFKALNNPFAKFKDNISEQFDIVISGVEILSGGLRNINTESLKKTFLKIGLTEKSFELRYGALIKALKSGIGQHGGFALGFERFFHMILRSKGLHWKVNDLAAFPFDERKRDHLTGSPLKLKDIQWDE